MTAQVSLLYLITRVSQPKVMYFVQLLLAKKEKTQRHQSVESITDIAHIPPALIKIQDKEIFDVLAKIKTPENTFPLEGKNGAMLFKQLVETNRVHFSSYRSPPLKWGKKQYGKFGWIKEVDDRQRFHCWVSGGASTVLPLQPLFYVDPITQEAGELETTLDSETVTLLLFAPPLRAEEIHEIYTLLKKAPSQKEMHFQLQSYLQKQFSPILEASVDTWYCDWQSVKLQPHWFDVEMGIEYEGERINLLPVLTELVQSQLAVHSLASLLKLPDDKIFMIKLPSQRKLAISMSRFKKILIILTELYGEKAFTGVEKLRISAWRALQLSTLKSTLEVKHFKWQGDRSIQVLLEKFEHFKKNQFAPLPLDFCGALRHYQSAGVHWLQFLREAGLSGVLADDMGLGKTVQVLAHLLIEKYKKTPHLPSLIVMPTSLVMNWQQEALQFVPQLKLLVLYGQHRRAYFNDISAYDIVITTYSLLIRDEEILAAYRYNILILDEAQYIKNKYSRAGQVVRQLSAVQRLCLTGTPLENHLGELWSLFHFLLPGLLGAPKQFYQFFRLPIEKNQDKDRLEVLKQRIAPFFLRRLKQEVLTELPEKVEIVRPVLLTDKQSEVYENMRIALHRNVVEVIRKQGMKHSRIYILSALLKLRQICCDLRLLKINAETYDDKASAKLCLLTELLPTLVLEGRKILLFSQFTQMLALIENVLKVLKIEYIILTGKTQHRDTLIQQFQTSNVPLFLISLKAGGVGINLTKADTVIHYDPWWNPAVERQATDRAHRIGQCKTVFVYRLVASGTIEDKILMLQQKKKFLFEAILSGDQLTFEKFSQEDIEQLFAPLEG